MGLISREEAAPAENAVSLSGHAQQSVHLDNHLLDERLSFRVPISSTLVQSEVQRFIPVQLNAPAVTLFSMEGLFLIETLVCLLFLITFLTFNALAPGCNSLLL